MVICCEVTIGKLKFTALSSIEIKSSWRNFTDTARISIPKAIYGKYESVYKLLSIRDLIKTGDKIVIKLGYNTQLITEFEGYVAYSPYGTIPYVIECEDEMWQLKRKKVSVSLENATVKQIIQAVAPEYDLDCVDELYGDFSMKETTPVKVFRELQEKAGLYTFFRGGKLVCGKIYLNENLPKTHPLFKVGYNVIDNDIQFVNPEDVRFKAIGLSKQRNGSVLREEIGEDGGNIERWSLADNVSQKELKELLKKRYDRNRKHFGLSGTITSFGFPIVKHGQVVHFIDNIREKRDSKHFVDSVEISVSPNGGYRRTIEISREFNANELPLN